MSSSGCSLASLTSSSKLDDLVEDPFPDGHPQVESTKLQDGKLAFLEAPCQPEEIVVDTDVPSYGCHPGTLSCDGEKKPDHSNHFVMVRDGAHGRQPQRRRLRPLADVLASEDRRASPRPSFYTCELPDNLPEKEAAPPNRVMHDIAVQRLHDYLQGVQRHPRKLVKAVADHRGEASMSPTSLFQCWKQ